MKTKGLLDVTSLQIFQPAEGANGNHYRIFFEDKEGQKWWWVERSIFTDDKEKSNLLVCSKEIIDIILQNLEFTVRLKKGGELTIKNYAEKESELFEQLSEAYAEIGRVNYAKSLPKKPIRVSRGHMGDLEAASLNCGNPELQATFEKMKENPGFEIVDNPKPGEFLQDLSIMFMYPSPPPNVPGITGESLGITKDIFKITPSCKCTGCRGQVQTWSGDAAKCAFTTGKFSGDNWRCATVRMIRQIADRLNEHDIPGVKYSNLASDQRYATIETHHIREFDSQSGPVPVCLWVGWYKDRGRTEGMWLMFENEPPRRPTEQECLIITNHYILGYVKNYPVFKGSILYVVGKDSLNDFEPRQKVIASARCNDSSSDGPHLSVQLEGYSSLKEKAVHFENLSWTRERDI